MAEAAIQSLVNDEKRVSVTSRGLLAPPQSVVHPLAVKACRAADLKIDKERPAVRLSFRDVHAADLILVMEYAQRSALRRDFPAYTGKVYGLGHWQNVDIEDPLGGDEQRFVDCLSTIQTGVEAWLDRLRNMALAPAVRGPQR